MLIDSYVKPLHMVHVMVAYPSVASSKLKIELDSHAGTCVVGDNYSVIYDHNLVTEYSYNAKGGHRSAKTVDAMVGYQDPQSGQKFILTINQAFCIMV